MHEDNCRVKGQTITRGRGWRDLGALSSITFFLLTRKAVSEASQATCCKWEGDKRWWRCSGLSAPFPDRKRTGGLEGRVSRSRRGRGK